MEIAIPTEMGKAWRLKPGQKLRALEYGGQIRLVPVMSMEDARGFAKGIDTTVEREPDREFGLSMSSILIHG